MSTEAKNACWLQQAGPDNSPKFAPRSTASISAAQEDAERERRIDELGFRLRVATNPEDRRDVWIRLKTEIAARSPEAVERLERARGLRS